MQSWIILDRDGVINVDSDDYIKSVDEWRPLPGSIEAIAALSQAGYRVLIATNQSGIARGLFDIETLEAMHNKLRGLVEAEGGSIAGIFYCPHHPEDQCDCRKPRPGLLDEIERQFHVDLQGVPFVGDSERDLLAARAKQCQPILVRTGKGEKTLRAIAHKAPYASLPVYKDLAEYVKTLIIKH